MNVETPANGTEERSDDGEGEDANSEDRQRVGGAQVIARRFPVTVDTDAGRVDEGTADAPAEQDSKPEDGVKRGEGRDTDG